MTLTSHTMQEDNSLLSAQCFVFCNAFPPSIVMVLRGNPAWTLVARVGVSRATTRSWERVPGAGRAVGLAL